MYQLIYKRSLSWLGHSSESCNFSLMCRQKIKKDKNDGESKDLDSTGLGG